MRNFSPRRVTWWRGGIVASWRYLFIGYLLCCVIVIAGYGNIVSRTTNGRAVCIFYALFGMPLTCLTLETMGEKLRNLITSLIHNIKKSFHRSNTESVHNGILYIITWVDHV